MPKSHDGFILYAHYPDGSRCPLYTSTSFDSLDALRPAAHASLEADGLTAELRIRPSVLIDGDQ